MSLEPKSDGPGAVVAVDVDDAAGAESSGFFPNSPPPKRLPVGAVLPDVVWEFSAGLEAEPKSGPVRVGVLVPKWIIINGSNMSSRSVHLPEPFADEVVGGLAKTGEDLDRILEQARLGKIKTYSQRSLAWNHPQLPVQLV